MRNEDFSQCEFIDKYMCFTTYDDFCDNRQIIKELFKTLPISARHFYKWYVYANIFMTERYKNAIWTFLNFDDFHFDIALLALKRRYEREFHKK